MACMSSIGVCVLRGVCVCVYYVFFRLFRLMLGLMGTHVVVDDAETFAEMAEILRDYFTSFLANGIFLLVSACFYLFIYLFTYLYVIYILMPDE